MSWTGDDLDQPERGAERKRSPSRSPLDPPFPPCGFAVGLLLVHQDVEGDRLPRPPMTRVDRKSTRLNSSH